jgi:lycopene cyclase CruA
MWQWGNELYTIHASASPAPPDQPAQEPCSFQWHIIPVSSAGAYVHIDVILHDATVSTQAEVRVSLNAPRFAWPWQQTRSTHQIGAIVQACTRTLREMLPATVSPDGTTVPLPPPNPGQAHALSPLPASADLPLEQLRARYPRTVAAFEEMDALDHLAHVWSLTQGWEHLMSEEYDPNVYETVPTTPPTSTPDYDLIYAGGGLALMHAAVMALRYGWRVLIFARHRVSHTHREWNIGHDELQALVDTGIVTWEELEPVIMRKYRTGLVSFYSSPYSSIPHSDINLPGVLDLAIDANGLLQLMRRKLETAGGTILDERTFRRVRVYQGGGSPHVEVELDVENGNTPDIETYSGRLLLDGMGVASPLMRFLHKGRPFDSVCPTVGTVVGGFQEGKGPREYDPTIGDILISVADNQADRQFIWEGFPGRGDETTVYVFYYLALAKEHARQTNNTQQQAGAPPSASSLPRWGRWDCYSLFELYEYYFTLLPDYKKQGPDFRHIKPVYGYIPGRHNVRSHTRPLPRGVLPVGDSAAYQSPLTFCGFGSHVRNLRRTTTLLDYALRHDILEPRHMKYVNAFQFNASLNWVFSYFMEAWGQPHSMNELQNVFLGSLGNIGIPAARRFFQDRTLLSDYTKIVLGVLSRYPVIMSKTFQVLGAGGFYRWERDYLLFWLASLYAFVGKKAGPRAEQTLHQFGDRLSPAAGLLVRARYEEWRAMGWIDF